MPDATVPKARSPLLALFLAVLIDLLGFGIVLPLLPQYAKDYEAGPLMLGVLMASFSAMQFLFAPVWGRLSDRVGRRPVLMIGLAGSMLSYALFGLAEVEGVAAALGCATPVPLLLASRILAGLFGATIGTAYAYIADVTDATTRGRGMALIGAAFGLGFTIGPSIGGYANDLIGRPAPGLIAAGLSAVALLVAWRTITEPARHTRAHARGWDGLRQLGSALGAPTVGAILLLQFLATFCFANMEGTLALFARAHPELRYDPAANGHLFSYLGLCLLIAQGAVVRRLLPRIGEVRFNVAGCVLLAVGLVAVPGATAEWHVWAALAVAVFGFAIVTTSMASLLSLRTPESMQGEILGVNQSSLSLARIFGPAVGIALLPHELEGAAATRLAWPFWLAGGLMLLGLVWAIALARRPAPGSG